MMKGRPVYAVLSCLLRNRSAKWLLGMVVISTAVVFLNSYMVYNTQHQSGTETERSETHSTGGVASRPPTVWIYHHTVCQRADQTDCVGTKSCFIAGSSFAPCDHHIQSSWIRCGGRGRELGRAVVPPLPIQGPHSLRWPAAATPPAHQPLPWLRLLHQQAPAGHPALPLHPRGLQAPSSGLAAQS